MSEVNTNMRGEDAASYFQVLEKPTVHPGKCLVCGSTQRPVVMLMADVDYADLGYGALLLCCTCITQAASKFPVADEDNEAALKNAYQAGLDQARKMVADELLGLINRLDDGLTRPVYGSADSVPEQAEPSDTQDPERELHGKPKAVDGSIEQADESIVLKGSASVSGNPGDGIASLFT